jgi:hypothetical protein
MHERLPRIGEGQQGAPFLVGQRPFYGAKDVGFVVNKKDIGHGVDLSGVLLFPPVIRFMPCLVWATPSSGVPGAGLAKGSWSLIIGQDFGACHVFV